MLGEQVGHMNEPIFAAIASAQVSRNPLVSAFGMRVIAIVQDHELYIAKDNLNRVIVRTAFGQANPVQAKVMHHLTGLARFARMGAILVQSNPNLGVSIPMPEVT